jgi:hypothetical protein
LEKLKKQITRQKKKTHWIPTSVGMTRKTKPFWIPAEPAPLKAYWVFAGMTGKAEQFWIPAFAGMTDKTEQRRVALRSEIKIYSA